MTDSKLSCRTIFKFTMLIDRNKIGIERFALLIWLFLQQIKSKTVSLIILKCTPCINIFNRVEVKSETAILWFCRIVKAISIFTTLYPLSLNFNSKAFDQETKFFWSCRSRKSKSTFHSAAELLLDAVLRFMTFPPTSKRSLILSYFKQKRNWWQNS